MSTYYPYQNPTTGYNYPSYFAPQQNNLMRAEKVEVKRVSGKNGAEAYPLPPNSSILLLDETAPIIWLKTTDGGGYPTLQPYDISPHKEKDVKETMVNISNLEERLQKVENYINEYLRQSNVESSQPIKRIITSNAKESKSN